ncbi:hypothetical protein AB5J62_12920 [Amycolatopsis sp. cg5]|uniref:hypothetical protein n=1 Tax=Amycolatopsis sp. cg5 TaxID=3238802 RepID=UPI0035242999
MTGLLRRRRGLSYAVTGDALVLGGSVPAARLYGRAAITALPALLGVLDGHADRRELAVAVGVPELHVDLMLSMLGRHGAVESASVAAEPGSAAAGFFAAVAGHQADLRSGEELLAACDGTTVEVLGDDAFAAKLRAAVGTPGRKADRTLVVGASADALTERRRAGSTVLPVWTAEGELAIGPLIPPGAAPCPGCVIDGQATPLPERHHELAVAFVATRIPVLVTTHRDDATRSRTQFVGFESGRTRFVATAGRPGCPHCPVLGQEEYA